MKKIILVLLSVLLCLSMFSCEGDVGTSPSSETVSTTSSASSQPEKIYLELDKTKSQEYNDAIKAYNTFLNNNCYERNEENGYDIFGRSIGDYPVDIYTLFDMSHDGIPELLTKGPLLRIFSYQEGKVVLSYVDKDGPSPMSRYNSFLEDGSLVTVRTQEGNEYWFRKFIDNYFVEYVYFYDDYYADKYYFNGEEVSKEEYDNLTKDYFEAIEKKADLTWYEYSLAK